jgi:hypothetical protein
MCIRDRAIWAAWDREADIVFLYQEHYMGSAVPAIQASSIKSKGPWIPGVIDPASRARGPRDGERLIKDYKREGLKLSISDNAVDAGIYLVWQRLITGRLKVCSNCVNWLSEFRMYRRDEEGKIVKKFDHLMDATRYLMLSGLKRARIESDFKREQMDEEEVPTY